MTVTQTDTARKIVGYRYRRKNTGAWTPPPVSGEAQFTAVSARQYVTISNLTTGYEYEVQVRERVTSEEEYQVYIPPKNIPADTQTYTTSASYTATASTKSSAESAARAGVSGLADPESCGTNYTQTGSTDNTSVSSRQESSRTTRSTSKTTGSSSGHSTETGAKNAAHHDAGAPDDPAACGSGFTDQGVVTNTPTYTTSKHSPPGQHVDVDGHGEWKSYGRIECGYCAWGLLVRLR